MWFGECAASESPGDNELLQFVRSTKSFFGFVLEDQKNFGFLWELNPTLQEMAQDTFRSDIMDGPGYDLDVAIENGLNEDQVRMHGLSGRPLRFKFAVLNALANQWEKLRGALSIREWFKKVIDAIDSVLDSLIDAAGGAGGLIKEFKDSLRSLS